jgi:lipopolysaccharide transport system permease protein
MATLQPDPLPSTSVGGVVRVIVDAAEPRRSLELREIWAHRELLFFLAWRDVKIRYKQSVVGAGWAVLQPVLTTVIFTLIFGRLADVPSQGIPYPLFAYAGLVPWTFFASALSSSASSLVGSSNLLTKTYFPRLIIPAAAMGASLLDFAISYGIIAVLMAWYGYTPGVELLLLPVLFMLLVLLTFGLGTLFSAINVKYRDVRYALPFFVQLLLFATPVIYPSDLLPKDWRWLLMLNPLTGIIEGFRSALLGTPAIDWGALLVSAAVTIVLMLTSVTVFRRTEKGFADVV